VASRISGSVRQLLHNPVFTVVASAGDYSKIADRVPAVRVDRVEDVPLPDPAKVEQVLQAHRSTNEARRQANDELQRERARQALTALDGYLGLEPGRSASRAWVEAGQVFVDIEGIRWFASP